MNPKARWQKNRKNPIKHHENKRIKKNKKIKKKRKKLNLANIHHNIINNENKKNLIKKDKNNGMIDLLYKQVGIVHFHIEEYFLQIN